MDSSWMHLERKKGEFKCITAFILKLIVCFIETPPLLSKWRSFTSLYHTQTNVDACSWLFKLESVKPNLHFQNTESQTVAPTFIKIHVVQNSRPIRTHEGKAAAFTSLEELLRRSPQWHFYLRERRQGQGQSSPPWLAFTDGRLLLEQQLRGQLCVSSLYCQNMHAQTNTRTPQGATDMFKYQRQSFHFTVKVDLDEPCITIPNPLSRLGRCNYINAFGRMEVRVRRPSVVFLATPWVQVCVCVCVWISPLSHIALVRWAVFIISTI